jgi:glycosyltransferase involved in cell wall biosynthesis
MRVLHVLNELNPSGAEVMLQHSKLLWDAHGVQAELLATSACEGVYADVLRAGGYPVHHLYNDKSLRFFLRYARFLRARRFHLIQIHNEGSCYWLSLASLLAGCRVIRVVHNRFDCEGLLRWRRKWQRRHLIGLGIPLVAVSESVRHNEAERFRVASELILNWIHVDGFFPPGIEQRAQARARWGFAADDVVIVSVGNCSEIKNHHALIHAVALCKDLPALRYLHVGREDAQHSELALVRELRLQDRVIFAGWTQNVLNALHAADLFVMPSLCEGLGNAAVEALATGLPALLSDVPGLRDCGAEFPGVELCKPDAASIAGRLREFYGQDAASRCAQAKHYPAIAQARFSPVRGVAEYMRLYRRLLDDKA